MTRLLLAAALLGALAVGLFLWTGLDRGAPDPRGGDRGQIETPVPEGDAGELERPPDASVTAGATQERRFAEDVGAAAPTDLLVRVVDPGGQPLAGISLLLTDREGATGRTVHESARYETTDRQGRALFRAGRRDLAGSAEPWWLVHLVTFEELPRLALTPEVLSADEVVSVQPYSGSIEVVVTGKVDRLPPAGTVVELTLVGDEERLDPTRAFERPSWEAETFEDGRAVFPHVELGRTWEALAYRPVFDVRSRGRGPGPLSAGARITLEILLGSNHPVLSYRAVDETGTPFPNARLELERFTFFGGSGEGGDVHTDAEGRFTVDVENGWLAGGSLLVRHEAQGRLLSGYATLDGNHNLRVIDKGDVVLVEDGLLVSGVVVNEYGNHVPGAEVHAGRHVVYGDNLFWSFEPENVETETGADGAFTLAGKLPDETFQVWAFAGEDARLRSDARQAEVGDHVELVLTPHWKLSGQLVVDDGVPLDVQLRLTGENHEAGTTQMTSDGNFEMERAPAGVYDLVVLSGELELVRVPAIALLEDVDVGAVDLTGKIMRHEVVLATPAGTAPEAGTLSWKPCGAQESWTDVDFEGARATVFTGAECIDVRVFVRGYRTLEIERLSGSVEAGLIDALRVRLVLRTDGKLPEFPYTFGPDPEVPGGEVEPEASRYFTEDNRELVYLVSLPGRMKIGWSLERRAEGLAVGANVLSPNDTSVVVRDMPGEQVFYLDLDGTALTRLADNPPF